MIERVLILLALFHSSLSLPEVVQLTGFATSGNEHQTFPAEGSLNAAGGRFIFVHSDSPYNRVIVFERNDEDGLYSIPYQTSWPRKPVFITTNGNWFGTLGGGFINTVQLASNGAFVNSTEMESPAKIMQFLNDNTLLLVNATSIETYEFNASAWTKIHTQSVSFSVVSYVTTAEGSDSDCMPHITDTTLAAFNPNTSSVELYTRNQDKSWSKVDEISLNVSQHRATQIVWNGDDTVVLGQPLFKENATSFGKVTIYEKNSGTWSLTHVILHSEVSSAMLRYFGMSLLLLDRNTIAIGAPGMYLGDVFLMRRKAADWNITTQFIGGATGKYFGYNLMKSDYDLIVQTADGSAVFMTFQVVIPSCYRPFLVKCLDITYESDVCQNGLELVHPYNQLHSVREDCIDISLRLEASTSAVLRVSFTNLVSDTSYCNITVNCAPPTAPITISQPSSEPTTPISTSQPVSVPLSFVIPVTEKPGETVNGGSQRVAGYGALFVAVIMLL